MLADIEAIIPTVGPLLASNPQNQSSNNSMINSNPILNSLISRVNTNAINNTINENLLPNLSSEASEEQNSMTSSIAESPKKVKISPFVLYWKILQNNTKKLLQIKILKDLKSKHLNKFFRLKLKFQKLILNFNFF